MFPEELFHSVSVSVCVSLNFWNLSLDGYKDKNDIFVFCLVKWL